MTDIVEEARAMLAQATPGPWNDGITEIDAGLHGCTSVVEATCNPTKWGGCGGCELRISKPDRALIAAAPRILAALADECERLRAENARLREAMPSDDVRDEINDASVMLHEDGGMPATIAWIARLDAAKGMR